MKKFTFSALLLAGAMLMGLGASAQVAGGTDYVQYDANLLVPTNIDYVTLNGAGTKMGYYALPDPAYHPNYNAAALPTAWALTAGFVWDWTVAPVMATAKPGAANYVEITYTATGNYVVNVAEHAPAAMGGCVDATPTVMNVTVVAPPTATASIAPAGWQVITANASYQICSAQAAQTVTVAFNEAVPVGFSGFSFAIASKVETIDGADAVIDLKTPYTIVQDFPATSAGRLKTGQVGTLPSAAFTAGNPASSFTFLTPALNILKKGATTFDARTKYTFKLVRTGTADVPATIIAATNDFRSAISQKSDYLAGAPTYYTFTNNEVSFIVNPTPVTGPIYHIANTFAY